MPRRAPRWRGPNWWAQKIFMACPNYSPSEGLRVGGQAHGVPAVVARELALRRHHPQPLSEITGRQLGAAGGFARRQVGRDLSEWAQVLGAVRAVPAAIRGCCCGAKPKKKLSLSGNAAGASRQSSRRQSDGRPMARSRLPALRAAAARRESGAAGPAPRGLAGVGGRSRRLLRRGLGCGLDRSHGHLAGGLRARPSSAA